MKKQKPSQKVGPANETRLRDKFSRDCAKATRKLLETMQRMVAGEISARQCNIEGKRIMEPIEEQARKLRKLGL